MEKNETHEVLYEL
jgi:hypothetical protein